MDSQRPVVVFFDRPDELARIREVLGADARYFNGVAEGLADRADVARLVAAGLTVEDAETSGPGSEPPADWLGTGGPPPGEPVAPPPPGPQTDVEPRGRPGRRVHVGGAMGGLIAAAGILVLLQQLTLIDPTSTTGVVGLAAGGVIGLVATILPRRLRS